MQKEELITTHMLLFEVSKFVTTFEDDVTFEAYNNLSIGPKSVHRQKDDHEQAVFTLLDCINKSLNGPDPQPAIQTT